VDAKIAWHCCLGAGYGNTFRMVEDALPRVLERWMAVNVEQFALDFSLRGMADVKALDVVPRDREVQVGVIDIRTLYIESDDEIVDRIHKVLEHIEPERVYLSTDCGLKALPRLREAPRAEQGGRPGPPGDRHRRGGLHGALTVATPPQSARTCSTSWRARPESLAASLSDTGSANARSRLVFDRVDETQRWQCRAQ
jgi:hypothetical protein